MMTSVLNDIYNDGFAVVDVRTPAEYEQGHIVGATNLPLFTNEERAEVGTLYVQTSRDAAIQRGLQFVGHKLASFVEAARALDKPLIVYCWRGGMRSSSMLWLFTTAGLQSRTIPRGYKEFRQHAHERITRPWQWQVVCGKTGSGKTTHLREMASRGEQVLDLERLANHRGSSFGGIGLPPQPTTEHMLNLIDHAMRNFDESRPVWLEDESRTIGRVHLPEHLYNCIRSAPRHELDVPIDVRIANLVTEYGALPANELAEAFERIREKFGGERTQRALAALEAGNLALAAEIALEYYDRTYEFSAKRR